jgi:hypothetical protein
MLRWRVLKTLSLLLIPHSWVVASESCETKRSEKILFQEGDPILDFFSLLGEERKNFLVGVERFGRNEHTRIGRTVLTAFEIQMFKKSCHAVFLLHAAHLLTSTPHHAADTLCRTSSRLHG